MKLVLAIALFLVSCGKAPDPRGGAPKPIEGLSVNTALNIATDLENLFADFEMAKSGSSENLKPCEVKNKKSTQEVNLEIGGANCPVGLNRQWRHYLNGRGMNGNSTLKEQANLAVDYLVAKTIRGYNFNAQVSYLDQPRLTAQIILVTGKIRTQSGVIQLRLLDEYRRTDAVTEKLKVKVQIKDKSLVAEMNGDGVSKSYSINNQPATEEEFAPVFGKMSSVFKEQLPN